MALLLLAPPRASRATGAATSAPSEAPPSARAATSEEKARALTARGADAMAAGDPLSALAAFREANQLHPSPRYRYNLATAERATGHLVEAVRAFRDFLANSGEVPEAYRQDAQAQLGELAPHVGRLKVRGPRGTRVSLDGEDPGELPLAHALVGAPGQHQLFVGEGPRRVPVTLRAGQTNELELPAQSLALRGGADGEKTSAGGPGTLVGRWWFWAAVAGVATAVVVATVAASSGGDARCSAGATCLAF